MKSNLNKKKLSMFSWAKELFPYCRSITGEGIRKSLSYFEKINPELKRIKFKTGKKVFDWTIPKEWNIKDGYIKHESGKKFCRFKENNLNIVGYSRPVNFLINRNKLIEKIHSLKQQPNSIPYVTSYYNEDWGFCMTEKNKKKLPYGKYNVFIDSELKKGSLDLSHAIIRGKSKKEIFFSSYLCHPSMANNELSGPVVLNKLILFLKEKFKKLNYSYRFVLLPETIGSIAYLSKYKNNLKNNVICGYNLTCLGDKGNFSYIKSRNGNTLADSAIESSLRDNKKHKIYSYLHRASDERQYCSPGIDLPLCSFSRSLDYKEYHTDQDSLKIISQKNLEESLEVLKNIIIALELGLYPKTKILCEPNMGKRGLYPLISKKNTHDEELKLRMNLIAYSDGVRNIFDISNLLKQPLSLVIKEYRKLKDHKIIS
jgi:aminopeptidase-like protein|tara:strand:+ start:700 stop:1983 length:1284 start_codon:yes stop_codon:yes gene_type:complete